MGEIFLKVLNMSITASWMVLAVIAVTLIFKKIPKWINCLLWGLAGLRLILPFSFESMFSLVPSTDTLDESILISQTPSIDSGIPIINQTVNPALSQNFAPDNTASAAPMQILMFILSAVWLAGIAAMLIYGAVSYIKIKRKTSASIHLKDNIYYCDNIDTPFILGIIKPKIYIPSGMDERCIDYIIRHENAHLKRMDHLWKPLGFLILSFYWFNPALWAAYILLCRDIEKACDEKVIKNMDAEDKKCYSEALVASSMHRRMIMACPLAFGEVGVKARIKNMLSYRKPTLWIIIAAVILSIVLSVCFLTNPATAKLQNIEHLTLEKIFDSPAAVLISTDGQTYVPADFESGLYGLGKIKISRRAVSENSSEERKISKAVVLQTEKDTKLSENSRISGTVICFNEDMTEVWAETGVKPTLTYKVLESKKAKEIFEKFQKDIKPREDKADTEFDAALGNSENNSDKTDTSDSSSEHITSSENSSSEHGTGFQENSQSSDISQEKPGSVKVNDGIIVEIRDGLIIVERDKNGDNYIHTNDDKFSHSKRFAFKTDKADKFKIGDRVTIAHNGIFENGNPPVGIALGVSKSEEE